MSSALDRIRDKVGPQCLADSCSRDGCEVDTETGRAKLLAVDADKAFPAHRIAGKRCDFVLFLHGPNTAVVAAPIELKSGRIKADGAADQLRAGAAFADRVAPPSPDIDCLPILFHGNALGRQQRAALGRHKIEFRGASVTIRTACCCRPGNLAAALGGILA